MELSSVLAMLRRWSLTLIASAVAAGAVAYVVASSVPPTYSAEARVLVGPINTDETTLGASQELVETYASLVSGDEVITSVIETLGLNVTPAELRKVITARGESVTRLVYISAKAGDPADAAAIANEAATTLREIAARVTSRPEGEVTLINRAEPDPETAEPVVPLIALLAGAAGLVAAVALVLLIDFFGNTVSSGEDVRRLTHAPVLASISVRRPWQRNRKGLVVEVDPASRAAYAYRLLASHVIAAGVERPLRRLFIVSAEGQEGSGEVAANLAAELAGSGHRVRLLDVADDHEVTTLLRLQATAGLAELADENPRAIDTIARQVSPRLEVFAAPPGGHERLNDQSRVSAVLKRVGEETDFVVIAAAPIHRSSTAILWAREADGAILVVRRDRTRRDSVASTTEALRIIGLRLLGTVMHGVWRRPVREGARASAPAATDVPARVVGQAPGRGDGSGG